MKPLKRILLSLYFLFTLQSAFAQIMHFEHIGLEEGLSQVSVHAIASDSLGNMWFGTRNGINRYNGQEMTVYKTSDSEPNAIISNHAKKIISHGHRVWIQTRSGISFFDIYTERFTNFPIENIKDFCIYKEEILIATNKHIYSISEDNGQLSQIPIRIPNESSITSLIQQGPHLLIGTENCAYSFTALSGLKEIKQNIHVSCMYPDRNNAIWIGTENDGLFKVMPNGSTTYFDGKKDLTHPDVRCIQEDDNGNIWVGTFLGLNCITPKNQIIKYQHNEKNPTSLSHNSVWTLYKDKKGAIWAGTYFGGLNLFHPTNTLYKAYWQNDDNHQSINYRVVGSMQEDKLGNLWICTEGGGLNYFNRKTKRFDYFVHSSTKNSISHNNVKSIYNEGDSILWIGTHMGGLSKLDLKTGRFTNYSHDINNPNSIQSNILSEIISYDGNYLLSSSEGVLHFDPKNEVFTSFFPDSLQQKIGKSITCLLIDSKDRLWIGTDHLGLSCYDLKKKSLKTYRHTPYDSRSLASKLIYKIMEDHYMRIWIATSDGLNLYAPETNDFDKFSTDKGLAGNCVFSLAQSRYGDIILSTNKGISFFNYEKKSFKNVTTQNGFPLKELNQGGLFITSDGEIFAGGIDGMASFRESDFLSKTTHIAPHITGLIVNNKLVTPDNGSKILNQSIMLTQKIELQHYHTGFSLQFSDMSFRKSNQEILEYQLEGFDENWQQAKNNKATYTNLDAGQYTFKVRKADHPNLQKSLTILITPPFYKNSLAYFIYFILFILIIAFLNKQYLSKKRLTDKLELNQSQFKFFTNISHEFRTPLTIINGQTEVLLEEKNIHPELYRKILRIHKNTSRLKNLISELLDFRKQEQGHLKIKVSNEDVVAFLNEIYLSFIELAKHSEIQYNFIAPSKTIPLWFDKLQMEKVFYNLLSNAFKFTEQNGQIDVCIEEVSDGIRIEIKDNGKGISKEHIDRIFDRYYQLENVSSNHSAGTGIGLALSKGIVEAHKGKIMVSSKIGNGSNFMVSLPLGKNHFSAEEISQQDSQLKISSDQPEFTSSLENSEIKTDHEHSLLIVEDNPEVREFLKDLLHPYFNISLASNGIQGLEMAKELQPTLVLSDVLMPKMSGTEMCSNLKTNFDTSHIPVILLTARTAETHKIEGLETGADDYITKPFNTKVLIARIVNIINNRKAVQDKFNQDPSFSVQKITSNQIDQKFLEQAKETILKNLDNSKYDVISFASDMGLGRTSLFSKLKGITGKTPNEFINSIRLDKASRMLKLNQELTISEIAYSCGFSTPHYFSKSFKKHFGESPSQYR